MGLCGLKNKKCFGYASARAGLFAGKPAPTTACAQPPICVYHTIRVGAGSPANTVVAATVNRQEILAGTGSKKAKPTAK
ncbi:hypothetical protein DKX15_15135, partial [Enterococcus faecium]